MNLGTSATNNNMAFFQQQLMQSLAPNNRALGNQNFLQFPGAPTSFRHLRESGLMNSGTSNNNVDNFMMPQLPQGILNLAALQPQATNSTNSNKPLFPQQRNSLVGNLPTDNRTFSFMDQLPGRPPMAFGKDSFNDFSTNGGLANFMPNQGPSMLELVENMPQRHKMSMHLGHGKGNDK